MTATNPTPADLLALARAALAEPDFQIPRIGIFGAQSWIDYRNATADPALIAALVDLLERCLNCAAATASGCPACGFIFPTGHDCPAMTTPLLPAEQENEV